MTDPKVHVGNIASGSKITAEDIERLETGEDVEQQWTPEQLNPILMLRPYPTLEKIVKDGYRLHAFLSGGGLRVIYITTAGDGSCTAADLAYGEAPHIEEALRLCEEDAVAGGRPYREVYGKLVPHFLTGASMPSSKLDRWVRGGRDFDVKWTGSEFLFYATYHDHIRVPDHVGQGVVEAHKQMEAADRRFRASRSLRERKKFMKLTDKWAAKTQVRYTDHRGVVYLVMPVRFASGKIGYSYNFVSKPDTLKEDVWMPKQEVRISGGKTLLNLFRTVERDIGAHFEKF